MTTDEIIAAFEAIRKLTRVGEGVHGIATVAVQQLERDRALTATGPARPPVSRFHLFALLHDASKDLSQRGDDIWNAITATGPGSGAAEADVAQARDVAIALQADLVRANLTIGFQRGMREKAEKHLGLVVGDLAERAALDMDHDNRDHSRWYAAVKRARGFLAASPAAPQTDHRAARPGKEYDPCQWGPGDGVATPPSGSPPPEHRPPGAVGPLVCPGCAYEWGIPATAPVEPVTSGSPPGAAEACGTCKGAREVLYFYPRGPGDFPGNAMVPCPACRPASPPGSRGTR